MFIVGVKINCSDYISGAAGPEAEKLATEHLREISSWGLDFIEVSGGDYEVVGETVFLRMTYACYF